MELQKSRRKMLRIISIFIILLILVNIFYLFSGVLFHPFQNMDGLGIWLFKAKAMYIEKGFPNNFLHNSIYAYSHQRYPLGLPFIFSLLYKLMGNVNERVILLLYPLLYSFILFVSYKIFKAKTGITAVALLFTYIYSMFSPLLAQGGRILAGNADIWLVMISWIIIYLLYVKKDHKNNLIVISILIMIASQIKIEGIFLVVILYFLPISRAKKFSLTVISAIPFIIWNGIIIFDKIPSDIFFSMLPADKLLSRLPTVVKESFNELLNVKNWYVFWPILLIGALTKPKISNELKKIFLPVFFIIIFIYFILYLTSSLDPKSYINSSFDRILFQNLAFVYLLFFEVFEPKVKKHLIIILKSYYKTRDV